MIETAQAFGVDIGGSGIKAAPVNLEKGEFAEPRLKILTPEVSTPEAVAAIVKQQLEHFDVPADVPVGVAFPAPIKPGQPLDFMANLDQSWVGTDVTEVFSQACGRPITVVNDADAAGIGTALIMDGVLVPSTELGHIILNSKHLDAEKYAASSIKDIEGISYKKWSKRLTKYYGLLEKYFNPDLIVIGGGVSRQADKFIPRIDIKTKVVPATLRNEAGIIGAAYYASVKQQH